MSDRQLAPDLPKAQRHHSAEPFAREVHRALTHLHDVAYLKTLPIQPIVPLGRSTAQTTPHTLGVSRRLQQSLLQSVECLRPSPRGPGRAHDSRLYGLLRYRYVDALEIESVCERLGISRSEYFHDHRRALAAVCSILAESWTLEQGGNRAREVGNTEEPRLSPPRVPNLPIVLTSFVGREQELAEVRQLLAANRLVTLTGAGGCGKTRLALESARSLLGTYPDGSWVVQLAPIAEPGLVPSAIASSLSIVERAGEPVAATLVRHLQARHLLLVLDNCEHLLDSCAKISEALLESCPSLSILATSRQPLGIGGEVTFYVPSLESPPAAEWTTRGTILQAVLSHDATRLFLDRARSAVPSFQSSTANAPAIAEICRRLDGIPLAIELAAARVRALSPDQIAQRLDHDFGLLTSGSRTALPRQQTLKATLDWSHDLLSEQEAKLLRRLSAFAGGFVLEAAEDLCVGEGIEELEVVTLLAQLVDKSLVEMDAREGDARCRLLEPIRQYAWHRLEESGEVEATRHRHARWIAEYVREIGGERYPRGESDWLRRVAPEEENVRAALSWSADHDPQLGLRLADGMWRYWEYHGRHGERRRWLDEMLSLNPERTASRAGALFHAAVDALNEGDYERSAPLGTECLSIWRELRVDAEVIWPLLIPGRIASEQGDHVLARSLLERAEAFARERNYVWPLAYALQLLGHDARVVGDHSRSRRHLIEALSLFQRIGAQEGIGVTHSHLGALACSEGDYPRARAHLSQSVDAFRAIEAAPGVGYSLITLGRVSLREGDLPGARAELAEGLRLIAPYGWRPKVCLCLAYLGIKAMQEGDAARAARLAGAAEAVNPYVRALLPPDQIADLDACLAESRATLGEAPFAAAWAEGKAMSYEQAVEYALRDGAD